MRIRAVLFDVDGVLYDSMPLHAQAWQAAFRLINFRVPIKEIYLQEGRPDAEFVEIVLKKYKIMRPAEVVIKQIIEKKIKKFDSLPKPAVISGSKNFIARLRRAGVKIGLVTGSSQPKTLKRLKQDFGIGRESIVTGKEVKNGKPHPEPFLKAARKLGVKPSGCLVIENAPLGAQSAARAKMKCIALDSGPLDPQILRQAGAAAVYKSYDMLTKRLPLKLN